MSSRPTTRKVGGTQNTETAHNVTTDTEAAASTDDGMGGPGSRRGASSNQDATLSSSRLRSGIPVRFHFRGPSRTLNALDAALLFIVPLFLFLAGRLDLMYVGGYATTATATAAGREEGGQEEKESELATGLEMRSPVSNLRVE